MISGKALLPDALKHPIEHDDVWLFAPQRHDVLLEEVIAQHDQPVAIAVDQELCTLDGLAPLVGRAMAERHHHVARTRAQFGVDGLQDRGVEGALEYRDVHADHLGRAREQGARGV